MLFSNIKSNKTVFVLVLISCVIGGSAEPSCIPQFKCFANAPETYQLFGGNLTCPNGFVCNADYDMASCDPCVILNAAVCGFTCTSPTNGEISLAPRVLRPFACAIGQVCNNEYNTCTPCICSRAWTCNVNKPSEVDIFGSKLQCGQGTVCNKEYKLPCEICVTDISLPASPNQYPPNCNDGYGATQACRPGPNKSGTYYHCRKTINNIYDYEIKLCSSLSADLSCRSTANLCLV